jgi:hypothetical protein
MTATDRWPASMKSVCTAQTLNLKQASKPFSRPVLAKHQVRFWWLLLAAATSAPRKKLAVATSCMGFTREAWLPNYGQWISGLVALHRLGNAWRCVLLLYVWSTEPPWCMSERKCQYLLCECDSRKCISEYFGQRNRSWSVVQHACTWMLWHTGQHCWVVDP